MSASVASLFRKLEIDVFDPALLPNHENTMLLLNSNVTLYAGQPVVRLGRASARAIGVYLNSTKASLPHRELAA
jgi:hypothetical protein